MGAHLQGTLILLPLSCGVVVVEWLGRRTSVLSAGVRFPLAAAIECKMSKMRVTRVTKYRFFFSAGVVCRTVSPKANTIRQNFPLQSSVGDVITFMCSNGYYFDHATQRTMATITCQSDGRWSTLSGCTRAWQPTKHKDRLRWYKTVLNHLSPSKRRAKMF